MNRAAGKLLLTMVLVLAMLGLRPELVRGQQPGQMQQTEIEVSDQELQQFASAMEEVNAIQENARNDMRVAVEESGLTIESYNQIVKEMKNAQTMADVSASEEEVEKVQDVADSISVIQTTMQQEMQEALQDEDLTQERFQAILQAVQSDPQLQQRMQEVR